NFVFLNPLTRLTSPALLACGLSIRPGTLTLNTRFHEHVANPAIQKPLTSCSFCEVNPRRSGADSLAEINRRRSGTTGGEELLILSLRSIAEDRVLLEVKSGRGPRNPSGGSTISFLVLLSS